MIVNSGRKLAIVQVFDSPLTNQKRNHLKIKKMKKLIYGVSFLALVGIAIVGCKKSNDIGVNTNSLTETSTFDELFDKISSESVNMDDENAVYISYKWDKKSNTISIINTEEKELDFLILEKGSTVEKRASGIVDTIDCSNGDNSWSKTCDGKWSCGSLAVDCLDNGGCVEVCVQQMVYVPKIKTFYLQPSFGAFSN